MPELPEVETIVRELHEQLSRKRILDLDCHFHTCIEDSSPGSFRAQVLNQVIESVSRRGKYICIKLEHGPIITIHLRMTGKLLFKLNPKDISHLRLHITLSGKKSLFFIDARKFGRLRLWQIKKPFLENIGPEPVGEETVRRVLDQLRTMRPIKAVLLDQRVIAGIGNIYADEALFRAGIHPLTPGATLKKRKKERLSHSIPTLLKEAINHQGTTLSTYRTTANKKGEQQRFLNVYGRERLPCPKCHTAIERLRLNGRSTYFCPSCQK